MLLLSSSADLYWLGRYLSRSEALSTLVLDCLDHPGLDWLGLPLSITGSWQSYYQQYLVLNPEGIAEFFISPANLSGLSASLQAMRADAQGTRGCISRDLWLVINSLWLEWQSRSGKLGLLTENRLLYAWVKGELARIQQVVDTLPDPEVARFIRLGQAVESIDYHLRQLATPDMPAPPPENLTAWVARLEADVVALSIGNWGRVQESLGGLLAQARTMSAPGRDPVAVGALQGQLQQLMYRLSDAFAA